MEKRILLVDDEPSIHVLYREEFEDAGYAVISAYTGEDGLRIFDEEDPDIVVLDIQLGDMNGIDILRQMKEKRQEIPVILHSAFGEYKQDLASWASDAYIVKSMNLTELLSTLRRLIGSAEA